MTELEQTSGDSKQLLHLNATQRKTVIDISGNEANSYECNLCQQVFLRVKDLGGFQLLDLIITELKSHMTC